MLKKESNFRGKKFKASVLIFENIFFYLGYLTISIVVFFSTILFKTIKVLPNNPLKIKVFVQL
jgi:hypothetical protein